MCAVGAVTTPANDALPDGRSVIPIPVPPS
jgi:hypothetical protein